MRSSAVLERGMSKKEVKPDSGQAPMSVGPEQKEIASPSRRRFGSAGLVATGLLASVSSPSALGGELVCRSPSGFLSGNLSTPGEQPICAGRSPGYWKNHASWPIANRETALFREVFSCRAGSPYYDVTLLKVLEPQAFDKNKLGMHLTAAFLNAMAGLTPFLTVERIKSMFTEWQLTGYFSPTAGVKWTPAQIVEYLDQTQA